MNPEVPFALKTIKAPYKCVVLIERDVTSEFRQEVSETLVQTGCRYMMAWGKDCSLWDDSVDLADLKRFDYGEIPPEHFVMTTWHTEDKLSDVFEFAKHNAALTYDDVELHRCLVLDISAASREVQIREIYERSGREETQV